MPDFSDEAAQQAAYQAALTAQPSAGNSGQDLENIAIGFIVLQTVVMMLYYISRYAQSKQIAGIEMVYFMPAGYLMCIGNCILAILLVRLGGAGRPVLTLDMPTIFRLGKLYKAEEVIYLASVMFPKLAVLSLYIRLFLNPVRRIAYIMAAFVILTFCAGLLTFGLSCRPFAFNWDKTIPGGRCINTNQSYAYFSVPNLTSDLVIILLPLHPLWKLQVPRSTKVGLFVTFLLGGFGMITAIIRFVSFLTVDLRSDVTLEAPKTMKWTITEPAMYQIAATLPTLRPILTKTLASINSISIFSKLSQTSKSRNTANAGEHNETVDTSRFVKLDDYHYMQDSESGKGAKRYHGVMKTTDVTMSSRTNSDIGDRDDEALPWSR